MRTGRHLIQLVIALVVMITWSRRALADDDFFGTSPGDLSASHGTLDSKDHCNDCHVDGSKALSNDKCLACHDHQNLSARINAGKGFHSSPLVKGKKCESCHIEHKGKSYDIMGWKSVKGPNGSGEKGFDHDLTGWPLKGAHSKTECAECHKVKDRQGLKKYMGTDRVCGTCHAKDQPHKFVKRDLLVCERCHTESVWKPTKTTLQFNHDDRKDAAMPLLGSHRDTACSKCHPKNVFKLPFTKPDSCGNTGCHTSPHDGQLFGKRDCEWCHSPTFKTLKQQNFDHTEKTHFDLGPAHRKIKCYDCHTKALGEVKPTGACEQCHAKDNKHGDRFKAFGEPPRCGTCHPSGGPKFVPNAFNHAQRAGWALTAKHGEIPCRGCHRGSGPADFEKFDFDPMKNCMSCHAHAKVHADDDHPKGKYKNTQCLGCHLGPGNIIINTGRNNKILDEVHGLSGSFPLVKEHKKVPCADCHTGRDKKGKTSFSGLKPNCNAAGACHEDSLHNGSLGDKCLGCHTGGTWTASRFDHDKPFPKDAKGEVTEYPLKGEHKNNKCEACHPERKFAEAPVTCSAEGCHKADDAHKGRLGDKCEKCHVETGDNIFNHNTMSAFRLDGKHLTVRCADCHPSETFKPRPNTCFGCHPEPKVHKGQYGTGCEQCHSTRTWLDIKPLHDVGDFSLKGMHDNIACERCHRDNRPLAGSGNLCVNCHRQDDIHGNSLSPRCGECHTQWSFAPARFDHTRVGCNLTGLHRAIACFDCHKNGNFAAISAECVSCHHDDALRAGTIQGEIHATATSCASCHNPNFWIPQSGFGKESVCR